MMTFIGLILDALIVFAVIVTLVAACVAFILSIPVLLGTGVWTICDKIWHKNDNDNEEEEINEGDI